MFLEKAYIFLGLLIRDSTIFNIRDIWSWGITWVDENARREREEAERGQDSENQSVQKTSRALQTNPIVYENEDGDVAHKTHQQKHRQDWDR